MSKRGAGPSVGKKRIETGGGLKMGQCGGKPVRQTDRQPEPVENVSITRTQHAELLQGGGGFIGPSEGLLNFGQIIPGLGFFGETRQGRLQVRQRVGVATGVGQRHTQKQTAFQRAGLKLAGPTEQGNSFWQVAAALESERAGQVPRGEVFGVSGANQSIAFGSLIVGAGLVMAEGLGERLLDFFGFHDGGERGSYEL